VHTNLLRFAAVVAAAGMLLAACNRTPQHGHSHGDGGHAHGNGDHAHEEKTAQITVWTNGFEIFAEHKAPVAGKPTTFVTHVTNLETTEPRREGPVRFLLQQDAGAPIEHLQAAPARPGIYLPGLTFPKAGRWDVRVLIDGRTIQLGNVEVFADEHSAAHAEFPEPPEGVSFLKEQQWKILAKAEPVTQRSLVERVRVPATVNAKPGLHASVNAPIAGRLMPAEGRTLPVVGDKVEAGQVLALLQPSFSEIGARIVEAEAEVNRAKLAFEQASAALKRVQALAKAEARTARELEESEFAVRTAEANYKAAQALQGTYRSVTSAFGGGSTTVQPTLELRAPIAGIITSQAGVAIGEYVPAERTLLAILDNSAVFIEGKVPEVDAARLSASPGAIYERNAERGKFRPVTGEGKGRLVFTGIQVDPQTRTVPLVYEVPNAEGALRVGEAITLHAETARVENAVALPESAVVEEEGEFIAFVQIAGETFDKRTLKLGIRDGDWLQVVDGLQEGERVVTRGAYAIRLSSVSGVIPAHGHAH
jgi:cobalt-zinc-cadmium efflux system membrane fusion protein